MSWRIAAFAGGLAALWIAVASPVSHLDHHLLTAHMVQHLLIMLVAAPLVLLGVRSSLRLHWRPNLVVSWLAGSLTVIIWHVPAIFELALRSPFWHAFAHAGFFVAGTVFWWLVASDLFLPCNASVRRPFRIPRFLRLRRVPAILVGTPALRPLSHG